MRKFIIPFIVFIFPLAHTVVGQNNQTIIVRPETYREKQEREMRNVVEFINDLGSLFGNTAEGRTAYLTKVKNSRYSTFVEEKLAEWKKKGEFEKTADWQKRLIDSTAIKKEKIQESGIDKFARELKIVKQIEQGLFDLTNDYLLNNWLYDSQGEYDADKEALNINTFWGKIPIPIPIDKAKNMRTYIRYLDARFFIYNDQLALLSLSLYDHGDFDNYIYENQSPAAKSFRQKEQEHLAEEKRRKEQERLAEERKKVEKPYSIVEQIPQFPGGQDALVRHLSSNIEYPAIASKNRIQGRVMVRFVVAKDGSVEDVTILKGVDPSLDQEAIRVVKTLPKWVPGKENGVAVPVYYTVPIVFRLN